MGVTIIERLLALGGALTGNILRAIGGYSSNSIFPSNKAALPQSAAPGTVGYVEVDADGAMRARASVLTTRNNFRDDFSGSSLDAALTGTLTFTAGGVNVTGVGTAFLTQVTRDMYIKLNSDGETAWTRVRAVLSDTSLQLEQGYLGSSGGPAAASSTKWPTRTGSGGSFSVGSSLVNVLSGTTNGANTFILRDLDFALLHVEFVSLRLSQRIANQAAYAGLFDNVSPPTQQAAFIFDGTSNTTVKCRSSFGSAASDIQETTVTLPFGLTTALTTVRYAIKITRSEVIFLIAGEVVAAHLIHTPEQWTLMDVAMGVQNTGVPASSTTITADQIYARSYDIVDDGKSIPDEEYQYIFGQLTTTTTAADQLIISYTVPANRVACILGYMVSVDGNTDGIPVKVGKNTITTPTAAPGAAGTNFLRVFRLERSGSTSRQPVTENLSPVRPFAFAGDVLKISVTPSGTGSTIWRATLEILLRPA